MSTCTVTVMHVKLHIKKFLVNMLYEYTNKQNKQ